MFIRVHLVFFKRNTSLSYTACPTCYRTRHFFNSFTGPLLRVGTIRRSTDTHYRHIPFHFSHNEHTSVHISLQYRIIKEMLGSVASGTHCRYLQ